MTAVLQHEEGGSQDKRLEDCADTGRYTGENGNAAAVKKFRTTHGIGESTVRFFKKRYVEEIKKQESSEAS